MTRIYKDYVVDMLNAVEQLEKFTNGITFQDFGGDDKTLFAVIRALEIIGEASKRIPNTAKTKFPQIPWKEMAGMRDKLIHEYFGVNTDVVWKTVKEDIPQIKPLLEQLLEDI